MALAPVFAVLKWLQLVLHEFNPLTDPVGSVYECAGDGLTLEGYGRMCKDLDKPLLFRRSHFWYPTIYPHMLSPLLACNVYSIGPYTGFGILTILYSEHHVIFRNGLLGTHPAYNHHVTVFFSTDGKAYWHTGIATLFPVAGWLYNCLWEFYAAHMLDVIEESELRKGPAVEPPVPFGQVWSKADGTIFRRPRTEMRSGHGYDCGVWWLRL
jgi:hypothetical protein